MMTKKEYIQELLDRYMAAETTKEEENVLSDYFCSHQEIPAEWQNFSVMFRGLRQAKTRTVAFHKRTVLKWSAIAAVAAGILLLVVFRFSQEPVEELPMVAETIEQSLTQPATQPAVEEKLEETLAEKQPTRLPVKKCSKAIRKPEAPAEPMLAEADSQLTETEQEPAYLLTEEPDPFLLAAAEAQDIRSRGEHLYQEVAQMINNH